MNKKKRIFIIVSFCLLLAVTGVLNLVINNNISKQSNSELVVTTANFFTNYRSDRMSTYNQEVMYLQAIIDSQSTSSEAKTNAETELAKVIANMTLQTKLESVIMAKGFTDAAVSVLSTSLNVMIKCPTDDQGAMKNLTDSEVAQIVDVVTTETNFGMENIKIIPVE